MAANAPAARQALLIEPQALFAPYFVATLEAAGYAVVDTLSHVSDTNVRGRAAAIVVIDAGYLDEPLGVVRSLRRELPDAKIVVYAHRLDAMWAPLAFTVGADVVIGPRSDEEDFIAAVGPGRPLVAHVADVRKAGKSRR